MNHNCPPPSAPAAQIASMVTVLGESKPRVKNILTLGSCAAIVGAEVSRVVHGALGWVEVGSLGCGLYHVVGLLPAAKLVQQGTGGTGT
jgi:hypothetical protein